METVGVAVVSVTLEALATSGVAGSGDVGDSAEMSVSAGSTIGTATGGAATGGAATGAREASMELSRLSLFAHAAESSLKSPVTPDLSRLLTGRLGAASADFPGPICSR